MPTPSPQAPPQSSSATPQEQSDHAPGNGLHRYVTTKDGVNYYHVSHPIPPEPTEQQLSLWRDLDVYEDLDTAIRDAKAVTHALYCMQRCHSEFNEGEASELMQLSYLGMKVCDNALSLAKKLRQVALKWGERSEEFRKMADLCISDLNHRTGGGPGSEETPRQRPHPSTPSNSRKNGPSRGAAVNKGEEYGGTMSMAA